MAHSTFRWVINVASSSPPMHMQIDVWPVSNLTVILLSYAILNLTREVQMKVLAFYSLRYGTIKRGNGDATSAVCRLRSDVSEVLYAIPTVLYYYTKSLYAKQWSKSSRRTCYRMTYASKYVRRGDAIQDVRSHKDLLCNVILFVGRTIYVAISVATMIWCDHCLLVSCDFVCIFKLRNVCSLVSGLPIWIRSVSDTIPLRTRRMALRHDWYV